MESGGSLSLSQEPATCHPEPDQSNPYFSHLTSRRSILIFSSLPLLNLPIGLLPSGFPSKTLYTPLLIPIRAACFAHLSLLYFITQMKSGEECRAWSSFLSSLLHSTVASWTILLCLKFTGNNGFRQAGRTEIWHLPSHCGHFRSADNTSTQTLCLPVLLSKDKTSATSL